MSARHTSPFRAALAALAAGDARTAVPILRCAVQEGDGDGLAWVNLGLALTELGELAEAETALRSATEALPALAEPWARLGQIVGIRGDAEAARQCFAAALLRDPGHVVAIAGLAALAEAQGEVEEAGELLTRAARLVPEETELDVWAARLALRRDRPKEALRHAERCLRVAGAHEEAAKLTANALHALYGAEAALREASARAEVDPFSAAWPLVSAALHARAGQLAKAVAELRLGAALAPDHPGVQAELGLALAAAGHLTEAERALRVALRGRPNDAALRNRLATVLWKAHRIGEARSILDAAVADLGADPVFMMNQALLLNLEGRQEEALAAADAVVANTGGACDALVTRLCVLPYHPATGAGALRDAAIEAACHFPSSGPPLHFVSTDHAERKLRVGLLSGNLCSHPVGWLTVAGIEALPDDAFCLHAYSLRERRDPIARRFRAKCQVWRELGAADAVSVAATIAKDGIDILLDLGGFGEGGCPAALALRPAPVQIKWVGSQFSTTGLTCIDWMLTDRWETPIGFERFYTERLLRLPDGYVCYAPPPAAPPVGPLPALRNGHVTFGCFNNLAKLTQPLLHAWADILDGVAGARLVLRTHALSDETTSDALQRRLVGAGIDPARVDLHGGVPHLELLAAYAEIDIALDPFPYAGGLTVCEALWMGVPVVSLHGDSFAGRHGLSHLSNVGLQDWSVGTVADYNRLAIRRARVTDELVTLRAGLRERMRRSPLCDAPRFGRSLADALRSAWRGHCQSGEGGGVVAA
jgi:predicted O-linked N-acetylglucosamine transferase (SPINDLY family)